MSVVLDTPRRVGDVVVAALCRQVLTPMRLGGGAGAGIALAGAKVPVAILLAEGGGVRALGLDGAALADAQVEALCPGALTRMAEAAAAP
ncbi:MAG: hypothetical protein H6898_08475 [Rhodobacter sp.]|nr:hypothetical protein [Rhodobacter sp.]